MNDHRELQSAHPAASGPFSAKQKPGDATAFSARPRRWVPIAVFAVLVAGVAWAIGRAASHRIESRDIEIASRRQEPYPGIRKDAHAAFNATIVRMGWVANLDGTAVAYDAEAEGLITPDGQFRTDLSPREAAEILHLDVAAIAKKGSPLEIDPDAVLFRAQAGTLTAEAKAMARKRRREQAAEGRPTDAAWDVRDFAFTLERLRHPNEEDRTVLAAISRTKRLVLPRPGDTIRAVPATQGELGAGKVALWPGMLPPEAPMARPVSHQ